MESWRRDDSGQLIVVAALLIAVLFVGLALVLNSAIYAENIATRGETSSSDAMAADSVTAERLGHAIDAANYRVEEASYAERRSRIASNATEWDRLMGEHEAHNGRMYTTKPTAMTNGARVNQSEMGEFMPNDPRLIEDLMDERLDPFGITDRTSWMIAPDVQSRDYEATVKRGSLQTVDGGILDQAADLFNALLTGSDTFWIHFDDGTSEWRVYLVEIQGTDEVATVVSEDTGGGEELEGVCRVEGETATVRLSDDELEGDDETVSCPALSFTENLDRHDIYYAGADDVNGTYQFIVDRQESEFRDDIEDEYSSLVNSLLGVVDCLLRPWLCSPDVYDGSPNNDNPYTTTAIYDATVETTYQDDRITYTRNVTYPQSAR